MKKKRSSVLAISVVVILTIGFGVVLSACGGAQTPGGQQSAPPAGTVSASPSVTLEGGNAPGAVTEAGSSPTAEQTPSPILEEAMKIRSKVEAIKGVEDLAVVVTDTKKAVVAVVLDENVKMDAEMENRIKGAATGGIDVRVTADPGQLDSVRELEEKLYETGAMPMNQVESIWNSL